MPQKTILLADADARERQSIRSILRTQGYRILEAIDYQDAENVHQLHRGEIDLLVTALSLPGHNGFQLAEALRKREPKLKVLFVSAPVGAALCKFYNLETTDVHFLQKPLQATELLDRVRAALEPGDKQANAEAV